MKQTILSKAGRWLAVLTAALGLSACVSTNQDGGAMENTIALINATVPSAVAVAAAHETGSVPALRVSAGLIREAAVGPTADLPELVTQLRDLGMRPEAELAVLGGVALWQAYLAQHPDATTEQSRQVLLAVSNAITAGLPKEAR
jgi:hypothetical protein